MLYLHYQPQYMAKLYKILVFFIGLTVMNINVHAQLGAVFPYFVSAEINSDLLIAESYRSQQFFGDLESLISNHSFRGNKEVTDFTNYPNPAVTQTTIAYTLSAAAKVNLRVIDLTGKQLCVLVKTEQAAGKQEYYWELSKNNVTAGMYILVLQVDNKIYSRKIIVQ